MRELVDAAEAALQRIDLASAREASGMAVELLLAVPAQDRDDAWLELLNAAGRAAWKAKDSRTACAAWEIVLEARSRADPLDPVKLQAARQALAATLHELGEFARAREMQEQVLEHRSRTLPDEHPDLQSARGNLAGTLYMLGLLAEARALQERVLEIRSRTLPGDHPDLQRARGNLAATLYALGDLAECENLLEQALAVLSRTHPENHPDLQKTQLRLASLQCYRGRYAEARPLLEQVVTGLESSLPPDHVDLQSARANLAVALKMLGEAGAARELEEGILESRSRTLPEGHPERLRAQGNLAVTLHKLGEFSAARTLEAQVLERFSRTLPDDHPDMQQARSNLAGTLASELEDARRRNTLDEEVKRTLSAEFLDLARALTSSIAQSARTVVLSGSSREVEERCCHLGEHVGLLVTFAQGVGVVPPNEELAREVFRASEQSRGAALISARLAREAGNDPAFESLRARMRADSANLARLAQAGTDIEELNRVRTRLEGAQRELLELVRAASPVDAAALDLDPAQLASRLDGSAALVCYRHYTRWVLPPQGVPTASPRESLCAFVLRSDGRLSLWELGPIEPVTRAVQSWRDSIGVRIERGASVNPDVAAQAAQSGAELRRLVFDPLLPSLAGTGRLIVVLDDVLHLVPLDALPLDEPGAGAPMAGRELMGDRWRVETRCTSSELLWKPSSTARNATLLALGGASFNSTPMAYAVEEDPAAEDTSAASSPRVSSLLRGGAWERGFDPLASSGQEVRGIAALHAEVFGEAASARVLDKRKASREALEELAPGARWLHVATHGWFAPESVRSWNDPDPPEAQSSSSAGYSSEARVVGMHPMLLCGLALAGANLPQDELGRVPGLMTAEELSTLDLSACELAVLSACDTNVGERRAGQGVASLQKALHLAGARSVVTSLWKVPDEATRELMVDFYRRMWVQGKPKAQALWEAKKRLRSMKDDNGQPRYTTRDWAAWVLTGAPD